MLKWEEGILPLDDFLKEVNKRKPTFEIIRDNKRKEYYNIPCAFDIETSSFYEIGQKRALMYCWQFGIDNLVTMGRTWEEYQYMLDVLIEILSLSTDRFLVVYVHNLPYEFQWFRKRIYWEEVFILSPIKPVYARSIGIEYRCSLKLSGGKSLANVAKDLSQYKIEKKVGDLDYSLLRTPLTPLTKKELVYCEYDIRILQCYIHEKIKQDGDITKIPLTNTGYVRNFIRKKCFKNWKRYHNFISTLTVDPDEFSQLKRAFQGGFTHANAHYATQTLHNVSSADITSSYPTVMCLEKFPMSKAVYIDHEISQEEFMDLLLTKCCLFDIEIEGLIPVIHQDHIISESKCFDKRKIDCIVSDNGRVVVATRLKTTLTEQDYFTLCKFCKWEKATISNFRYYEKSYLPKDFILALLELYGNKTKLKGVPGEEVNYMVSKNMINAGYGMVVTDPVRDILKYEEDEFLPPEAPNMEEALEKYNSNIRRFLFYPWGVWVTAYARRNLFSAILEMGDDYIYSDTDSVKYLNRDRHTEFFTKYNNEIKRKIQSTCDYYRIDPELFSPLGKTLGVWDDEGTYTKFKTLGSKRYCFQKEFKEKFKEDDETSVQLTGMKFAVTIAGANKMKTAGYLLTTGDFFGNFDDGLIIPEDYAGRSTLNYINFETEGDVVDYLGKPYHYHELSSIHFENSDYSLSIFELYIRYLKGLQDISE